jgi:hypothetical protein
MCATRGQSATTIFSTVPTSFTSGRMISKGRKGKKKEEDGRERQQMRFEVRNLSEKGKGKKLGSQLSDI